MCITPLTADDVTDHMPPVQVGSMYKGILNNIWFPDRS